jgi:large subunit ribosomal protein L24
MSLARIKKGDDVIVLTGRERGKRGVVRQVMPKKGTALVQDINISKRHMKPTGTARQAGIVDKEQPIHLSNLALVDPKTSKPTRMRVRELSSGKKVRIATVSGEQMARE